MNRTPVNFLFCATCAIKMSTNNFIISQCCQLMVIIYVFFKAQTASSSRAAIEPVNQSRNCLLVDVSDFRDECGHRVQVAHDQTVRSTRPRTSWGTQRRPERALRHSSLIPGFKGLLDVGQVDLDVSPWWQWRPRHAASTIALWCLLG